MKCGVLVLVIFLLGSSGYAQTITVATGWRAPFSGDSLPEGGSHAKIVRMVFKKMGYHPKLVFMSWKRAYETTKSGKAAATFSWARTRQIEADLLCPKHAIAVSTEVGFYKKSRFPRGLPVTSFNDIGAMDLSVVGVTSYWYEALFASSGIQAHMVPFSPLAWRMLAAERVDLFIENRTVGQFESQKALGANKHEEYGCTPPLKIQKLYLVFSRKHSMSPQLLHRFDKTMDSLKAEMPALLP